MMNIVTLDFYFVAKVFLIMEYRSSVYMCQMSLHTKFQFHIMLCT